MAKLKKLFCASCQKIIYRSTGRFNEAVKFGWKTYCSRKCEYKYKRNRKTLFCENCEKQFERSLHEISPHNYCSQSCAAIVNNKKCLKGHARMKPKLKTCAECGNQYKKNTNNKKYCSMVCSTNARQYNTKELLEIIKNTAEKLGRTPARREFLGGIDKACIRFFGSWNNAVSAAGFIPNRSHDNRMYKRADAKSLDGHLCDSISELLIDNWFYENNIPHERDAHYPGTNHKADWGISIGSQKVFVEYFGLANDSPRYDRAVREKIGLCDKHKIGLCDKHKISLIPIYPKDIYPKIYLEDNLKEKFKNFLIV